MAPGAHFTCFTSTKVQILMFTCFTSTKVRIPALLLKKSANTEAAHILTQYQSTNIRVKNPDADGVCRGCGSNLLLLRSTLQANRGDGLRYYLCLCSSKASKSEAIWCCQEQSPSESSVRPQVLSLLDLLALLVQKYKY